MSESFHFHALGDLAVTAQGATRLLRGPKIGKVLALLLMRAGRTVPMDHFVDELWDDNPPYGAISTIRTHVYHLRRMLVEHVGDIGATLVETRPPGYGMNVAPGQLDATEFTVLAERARELLHEGRSEEALVASRSGLELWQGPVLAGMRRGRVLSGHVQRLEELRLQTIGVRLRATMRMGRYAELLPELRDLVTAHPLNEPFHGLLIEALNQCGRRGEALSAVSHLRAILEDELGLPPSEEIRKLYHSIRADGRPMPRPALT